MRLLFFLPATFFSFWLVAQTGQFPLDPGRISPGFAIDAAPDNGYFVTSFVQRANVFTGGNLNVTRLGPNGEVVWSQDYQFAEPIVSGRAVFWPSENALALSAFTDDSLNNKVVAKLDLQGQVLWCKRFDGATDVNVANGGYTKTLPLADGNLLLAGGAAALGLNQGQNNLFAAKISPSGQVLWSHTYCFSCVDNDIESLFGDIIQTSDGGFLMAGTLDIPTNFNQKDVLLLKLRPDGIADWINAYDDPSPGFIANQEATRVVEMPTGRFAAVGRNYSPLSGTDDALLLEVDKLGGFSRALTFDLAFQTALGVGISAVDSNKVVIALSTFENGIPDQSLERNILAQVNLAGAFDWAYNYYDEILVGYGTQGADLLQVVGGFAYLTNYSLYFDNLYPILVRTNEDGFTGCETPVDLPIIPSFFTVSSFALPIQPGAQVSDFPVSVQPFNLQLPVFSLELGPDTALCLPASLILNATATGADSYAWSTGSTEAVLVVNTPGEYAVTVTDTETCRTISDTISILASTGPSLAISVDTSMYCDGDSLVSLTALTEPGAALVWSTGATDTLIRVVEGGVYIVQAVNNCGTRADTVTVVLPDCTPVRCPLLFPTAITPDGDNQNDRFRPVGQCPGLSGFTLSIFNRWGSRVFQTDNLSQGWDGRVDGVSAPTDVYVYVARYVPKPGDREVVVKGEVTVLR